MRGNNARRFDGKEHGMKAIAVGIFCKTPAAGRSKTRLSPPLRLEECAALSACFIRDLAATIDGLTHDGSAVGYAVYTPRGSEDALRQLLPGAFGLHAQCEGEFGVRLATAMRELLARHAGAIMVNADSPTLPTAILRDAVEAVAAGDAVVLSPALDGGYTLIGLSRMHEELFTDIPWSTSEVYRKTVARAATLGLPVVNVPGWYDVDDAASLDLLLSELAGRRPGFSEALRGAYAPATRAHLAARAVRVAAEAVK
jgi:rSAM/selenodomain-associated transferase 1